MKKLFCNITSVDERTRTVVASAPLELVERAALQSLAGRPLIDPRGYGAVGAITGIRFPVQRTTYRDERTGEERVATSGEVVVTARVDDDKEWAKLVENVYTGLSLDPLGRAAGLVDVPEQHGATEAKLAKIAASNVLLKSRLAEIQRKMAYVSALLAKIEHPAGANGVPQFNLVMAGGIDLDLERQRLAAEAVASMK